MKVANRNPGKGRRPAEENQRSNDRARYSGAKAIDTNRPAADSRKRLSPVRKRLEDSRGRRPSPEVKRSLGDRAPRRSVSPRRAPARDHRSRSRSKSPKRRRSPDRGFSSRFNEKNPDPYASYSNYEEERVSRFSPMGGQRDVVLDPYDDPPRMFPPRESEAAPWIDGYDVMQLQSTSREWNLEERSDFPRENWRADKEQESESVLKFVSVEDSHPCIPLFDGLNPDVTARQWLRLIDEVGTKENWSSEKKKFQMAAKLSGPAKEWFLREDKLAETWNRIKHSFTKSFPSDMDFCWNVTRMLNRIKLDNESYSNYFTYKTMLLKASNIVGRKAVSCLIGGLKNEELKHQCFDQNFATPELLYTFLVQHEQLQKISDDPVTQQKSGKFCVHCKEYGHLNRTCPQKQNSFTNHKDSINHCIDVIINGYTLQGYNDASSQFVTIREDQANTIKLHYNKHKKTTIQGHRGNYVDALGDINVLLRIGSVVINTLVHVVPNSFQDYPVVIGDSLRHHPEVAYYEDATGVHFSQKGYHMPQNSSFSMNEKLVQKINEAPEKGVLFKPRDRPNQRQNADGSSYTSRFDQPTSTRMKFSKFR